MSAARDGVGRARGAAEERTLLDRFLALAADEGERAALVVPALDGGSDRAIGWREWADASRAVAAALVGAGVRAGAMVAVLAGNRPLWPIADLGILMAGGVSVGVFPTSAPAQLRQLFADAGVVVAICDTREQLGKLRAVRDELPALRLVVAEAAEGAGETSWEAWLAAGRALWERDAGVRAEVERRTAAARPDTLALLIYTSGSTGEPKGARLTHRYLAASARSTQEALGLHAGDSSLSFLPFSHAAERVFGQFTRIHCGMSAALVEDHTRVWDAARRVAPTLFGGLPRFYEKVYEALTAERDAARGAERERWTRTLALGRERSRLRRAGATVPAALEGEWRQVGAPLLARARDFFGGRVRLATSGGAKLPAEVAELLDALGVTVLGAYGLTEHLCVAMHRPERYDFDSVGVPMPGTELRIAGDGEILVRRGALTFDGYHGRPAATRDAFTADGAWLRTGDLGALDARGALHVTGRSKELLALSTGKKVAPAPIEARLVEDPLIAQAMLYGEGRKYVSALLCLRRAAVEAWARAAAVELPYGALVAHPDVRSRVQAAVDRVNETLSRPERVRRFVLLERELTLDAGELTPTLKVRRELVAERYREKLEALYE